MIDANFYRRSGRLVGFCVSGHAGYANSGRDIVCAAVSSAVQLTANAVTEVLHLDPKLVSLEPKTGAIELSPCEDDRAGMFVEALYLQLTLIEEQYEKTLKITVSEV